MTQVQAHIGAAGEQGQVQADVWAPVPLDVSTTPESIETGISCGMSDMCGEDPCLCGAADEYGSCACNGLETTIPTVEVTSSSGAVVAVQAGGSWYAVGVMPGQADLTVTTNLKHFEPSTQTVQVSAVPGMGTAVTAGTLVLAIALVAGVVRAAVHTARSRRAARGHTQEEAPVE